MSLAYFRPQRTSNDIVLYLSPKQPSPISVPFELQNSVSPDTWATRIPAIRRVVSKYSKPMLERIWFAVGFIAIFFVPVVLYHILLSTRNIRRDGNSRDFVNLRWISVVIFVGTVALFLIPVTLWKFIGRREMNRIITRWSAWDRTNSGNGTAPTWKVKFPGVCRDRTILTITLPPGQSPTSFHPDAYLPSYINGPIDADSTYFYPYKSEPGLPRMSVIGNVPLYTDPKPGPYHAYIDEKRGYNAV